MGRPWTHVCTHITHVMHITQCLRFPFPIQDQIQNHTLQTGGSSVADTHSVQCTVINLNLERHTTDLQWTLVAEQNQKHSPTGPSSHTIGITQITFKTCPPRSPQLCMGTIN